MSKLDAFFGRKPKKPATAGADPEKTAVMPGRQNNTTGDNAQNGGNMSNTSQGTSQTSSQSTTSQPAQQAGPAPTSPRAQANMNAAAAAAAANSGAPIGTTQVPVAQTPAPAAPAAPAPGLAPAAQPVYVQPVYLAGQTPATPTPAMDASAALGIVAAALAGQTIHHYVRQDGGEYIFTRDGQLRAAQALDNPQTRGRLIDALTGAPVSPADLALVDQLVAYSPELGQQLGVTSRGTYPYWYDPADGKRYLDAGKVPAAARFRVQSRTGRFRKEGDHWVWERDL